MRVVENVTDSVISLFKKTNSYITSTIKSGGISRAMNLENANFQLMGLLKNEKDVAAVMEDVSYGVDGTAYGLDAAAKVASQLAASGMRAGDSMKSALRGISGVAAMTNSSYEDIGRIYTQIAGQGRMMGDQLLQLSGRGMNAAATLAEYLTKVGNGAKVTEADVRDMVSKGKIDFDTFATAMDETFGEHAKKATSVNDDGYMTAYPLKISMTTAPDRQTPIGCQISIKSLQSYQTVDSTGMVAYVKKNQVIFSSYKNMKGKNADLPPYSLNAGDVNLDPGKKYELTVTVSMNSGLSARDSETFTARWKASNYDPDASIAYNPDTAEVSIVPFCTNENGELINNVTLSVYRREFDGTFTEIATGLKNLYSAGVPDPHPSLDYARYRIVATNTSTGESGYSDVSIPILEKAIIIQWNEEWTFFDATENSEPEQPVWTGSLLRLMYNVNVSDSYNPDVVFKEYVGRAHPVDYYGTQVGETATWSTDIPKDDKETLYALRRLAHWMGHVYVREPSGSGYWASVKVSFNQTHCEVVIPVTLDITRVDGEK